MNVIVALLMAAVGFGAAWSWQGSRADARVSALDLKYTREASEALATLAGRFKDAEDRGDAITKAGEIRAAELEQKLQETKDALKTATHNRPCLGGAALRVLGKSPGLSLGPAGPAPAGPLHGGSGTAAADPADASPGDGGEYATDSQVADWIATAGARYERCRGQLRDIRTWEVAP